MKKNLLSVLILVLLIVNIALTTVMMISVTGTNRKTAELVTTIATVLNLELYKPDGEAEAEVPLSATEAYDMAEIMIPLATSSVTNPDGTVTNSKQAYIMFSLSLLQNIEHKDYKKMGGATNLDAKKSLILDAVTRVVGSHTLEECQSQEGLERIRAEILKEVKQLFGSDFIYKIGLSGIKFSS
ncbi:MAG: flagellar basal body-associated FliL family protein [Acetatifactor sp.]